MVNVRKGDFVLDVATGTGTYLIEMAKKGAVCYGLDISPRMLERLKQKTVELGLQTHLKDSRVGQADKLPFHDKFFDCVTCVGMIEYYPMKYARLVLGEIKRVLKPDGRCFIDIPDSSKEEVQKRDYVYKYESKDFENMACDVRFEISAKNTAGWMIQYLLRPNR